MSIGFAYVWFYKGEQQMMGHESAVTGQTITADRHQSHNAAQDAKTPGL